MPPGQITVTGLTKRYKQLVAVNNLSFTVEPGRVTGFLGPNGAGKTTTLRMVLGLVTPSAGSSTIDGQRYQDLPDPIRVVGAVLEAASAHKGRTARNHLRVMCAAAGLPTERVDQVIDLVGLGPAAGRKYRGYSLGMRQRLGIAAAMLGDPAALILDEPANGLDPEGIRWMRNLLRGLAERGRTVLVSSHLLAEMEMLADDVVIIGNGQLIAQGPIQQVMAHATGQGVVRVRTPQAEPLTIALKELGAEVSTGPDGVLLVTGIRAPEVGAVALRIRAELHELVAERPDLEQAFLRLTEGKAAIR